MRLRGRDRERRRRLPRREKPDFVGDGGRSEPASEGYVLYGCLHRDGDRRCGGIGAEAPGRARPEARPCRRSRRGSGRHSTQGKHPPLPGTPPLVYETIPDVEDAGSLSPALRTPEEASAFLSSISGRTKARRFGGPLRCGLCVEKRRVVRHFPWRSVPHACRRRR